MSTIYEIPTPPATTDLLSVIFGDGLSTASMDAPGTDGRYVATFINREDELVALCVCDKPFVAYSGAALSMIPVDVANEMISSNDVTEAIVGNYYEIMNICSKLLMAESGAHLRLDKVLAPEDAADTVGKLDGSATVVSFKVDIPRYGNGEISFIVT